MPEYTFPLEHPIELDVRFSVGSLTVNAHDNAAGAPPTARVRVTPRDPGSRVLDDLVVEEKDGTLSVSLPRPTSGWFELPAFLGRHDERDAVDIVVDVPSGTPLRTQSFSADLSLTGRLGNTDLASGTSTVIAGEIDGDLRVRAGAGPISAERIAGALTVKTGGSELSVGAVGGAASIAFGSGSVHLGDVLGQVRVRSGSGTVDVASAHHDVDVVTGSGGLTVGLPSGVQARLDVVTGRGRLRTEMPLEQTPSGRGEQLTIRARTGNGDVTIRRAADPVAAAS